MAKIDQLDALYACVGLVGSDFGLLQHRFCRVLTITSQLNGGCDENLWIQHLLSKTFVFNINVLVIQQSLFAAMANNTYPLFDSGSVSVDMHVLFKL